MKVIILAGGFGTRLAEETDEVPKPMVKIGELPILDHIIKTYADQGFKEFLVATGYKHEVIERWHKTKALYRDWGIRVEPIYTGYSTRTGGRVKRLAPHLADDIPFMLTYGDGLADINFRALLEHHVRMRRNARNENKPIVTLTAVNPPSRFGKIAVRDGYCRLFVEKGDDPHGWVNAGFYVCEPEVLNLIPGDRCAWEMDILPILAYQSRLVAYQHPGEFQMMDTWRDLKKLRDIWKSGDPFWVRWAGGH